MTKSGKHSGKKEKLLVLSTFFFCHNAFKKMSAVESSESVYMRERVKLLNPFPHTSKLQQTTFENIYSRSGKSVEMKVYLLKKKLKTLWQKKKLLVLSNFSFCHDVFKSWLLQMRL